MEQDVIELKQNGPDGKYVIKKLPGRPKAGEVTLTRGLTGDNSFEKWVKDAAVRQDGRRPQERRGHRLRLRGQRRQALQADERAGRRAWRSARSRPATPAC